MLCGNGGVYSQSSADVSNAQCTAAENPLLRKDKDTEAHKVKSNSCLRD